MSGADDFLELEHLEKLGLGPSDFRYDGRQYKYSDVTHIFYNATITKHRVNFVPTGTTREVNLRVTFADGNTLRIRPESAFFGNRAKERHEAVMRAAAILMNITFNTRVERYEESFRRRKFVEWGPTQIHSNGDLFHRNELLFNIRSPDVTSSLSLFGVSFTPVRSGFVNKLKGVFSSGSESIDLSTDKDCFLYLMKHHFGIQWANTTVPDKLKTPKDLFTESLIMLAGKVAAADNNISESELTAFREQFGIDETDLADLRSRFIKAARDTDPIAKTAARVFEMLAGKKEALEFILAGLIQLAAADGHMHDNELDQIRAVGRSFQFSHADIDQLLTVFASQEGRKNDSKRSKTDGDRASQQQQAPKGLDYHLGILGLRPPATRDEIKKAYRAKVKRLHPDVLNAQGVSVENVKAAQVWLVTINASYEWLQENCKH